LRSQRSARTHARRRERPTFEGRAVFEHDHDDTLAAPRFAALASHSKPLAALYARAKTLADAPYPVLLCGEPGTGKRWLAHEIHELGSRRGAHFLALDCEADADDPLRMLRAWPSDAPTPATLYLERIDHMSRHGQAALARELEDARLRSRGSGGAPPLLRGARMLASCERPLAAAVLDGRFRQDIYYRLATVSLELPPLRELASDVASLAGAMLAGDGRAPRASLSERALELLARHHWPGNLRELAHVLARARALATSHEIDANELELPATAASLDERLEGATELLARASAYELPLRTIEQLYVRAVLERSGGNKTRAASVLGVNRTTLYRRGA